MGAGIGSRILLGVQTRTLMLLSMSVGLLILLAGGVLLVQLVNRVDVVEPSVLGETVTVGEMTIVVESSREEEGRHVVEMVVGGVPDPDIGRGFRMIASARPAPLVESCGAADVQLQRCTLVFETPDDDGSRQIIYERGDQSARWILALPG
jgi:hypothetical protein